MSDENDSHVNVLYIFEFLHSKSFHVRGDREVRAYVYIGLDIVNTDV